MDKDWRQIFQVEQLEKPWHINTEPGECNANCQLAKELICVCRCHGRNHGAALKKNVRPLDEFNDHPAETREDPVEATFSPEDYQEELAILA